MPLIRFAAPIAPIAWLPLGILLFGIGDKTAVFIVFMGTVFILTIATVAAVQNVDQDLLNVAASLGANRRQQWRYVILPAILPQVFTFVRINFFAAWMAVLAAEMVGIRNGLGAMIMIGRESANFNLILIGMFFIGACGWLIDSGLALIQRKLFWWRAWAQD
jgi:NitT/TauT family transport system permease protein